MPPTPRAAIVPSPCSRAAPADSRLTSRFMVDAALADELATAVRAAPVPEDAFTAERLLAALLSTRLPVLEQAPFTDRARAALRRVLREAEREHEVPEE